MRIVMLTAHAVPTAGSVTAECIERLRQWGVRVDVVLPCLLYTSDAADE